MSDAIDDTLVYLTYCAAYDDYFETFKFREITVDVNFCFKFRPSLGMSTLSAIFSPFGGSLSDSLVIQIIENPST